MTIERVKERLMSHTGTSPSAMVLQLKDNAGRVVAALDDPSKKLGYFSPEDGCVGVWPEGSVLFLRIE